MSVQLAREEFSQCGHAHIPPYNPAFALASVAPAHAVTHAVETPQQLVFDMEKLASMYAHTAPHRLGWY